MGIPRALLLLLLHVAVVVVLRSLPVSSADLYALVYKGCSNQSFPGGAVPPTVAALSSSLLAQSASAKFYKTSSSSSASSTSVFGLFQCRGDLSGSDCAACVSRAMSSWSEVCGASVAARVQLTGCLALYEISGFPQVSGTQMLFKTCGTGGGGGTDFEMRRDTAFAQMEASVGGGNGGFYATSYQQVYAMAQCEGDLSSGDCGQCVTQAVQHVEVECGGAPSGQVYLEKCYISYSYYPHGIPHGGGIGGQQTAKTVAIVLGGAVGLGFVEPGQEEGGLLMGTHGATGQKALGHGMHFDWGLDVCFFKVVSGIQRGLFFFGSSSSGHVGVRHAIPRDERGEKEVCRGSCGRSKKLCLIWLVIKDGSNSLTSSCPAVC
uniref:Gnk2-homologous domain-containing protein n=1 Tax=Oryza meridionalis TaxID=40149 RepID=A0A0E0CUZ7_9ORYZ